MVAVTSVLLVEALAELVREPEIDCEVSFGTALLAGVKERVTAVVGASLFNAVLISVSLPSLEIYFRYSAILLLSMSPIFLFPVPSVKGQILYFCSSNTVDVMKRTSEMIKSKTTSQLEELPPSVDLSGRTVTMTVTAGAADEAGEDGRCVVEVVVSFASCLVSER